MTAHFFYFILLIPLLGFLGTCLLHEEKKISTWVSSITSIYFFSVFGLLIQWLITGAIPFETETTRMIEIGSYDMSYCFYLDWIGAEFLALTTIVFAMIIKFCRIYLHRELGFKRFFLILFVFLTGMNILILAGSLDVLFIGWELVGLVSGERT